MKCAPEENIRVHSCYSREGFGSHPGTQLRKQDHVADALGAGEQDAEAVDADTHATRGRHAVLEGEQEVGVHLLLVLADLLLEHFALHERVVLLGVGRGHFHAADDAFEDVDQARVLGVELGQRAEFLGQVRDEGRLDERRLDLLAEDPVAPEETAQKDSILDAAKMKTPAERMFADVENSNWLKLGSDAAPVIYSFVDPNCPHCHDFVNDVRKKGYLDKNLLQIRIVPVGFIEGSLPQAAFLLASPDAKDRYFKHLDGDKEALPTKSDISTQAVQKNMALMQAWKFSVTPLTVYRSKTGEIKIVRGRVKDLDGVIADLPPAGSKLLTP